MRINHITIKNYKSIKELNELELKNLNILIGANGAGKSNFISFFKMLNMIIEKRLREYTKTIGADNILYFGKKNSEEAYGKIDFGVNKYSFTLKATEDDTLFFARERTHYVSWKYDNAERIAIIGESNDETKLFDCSTVCEYVRNSLLSWKVYHFHDTSSTAGVKKYCSISDNKKLAPDASNLAAFLYLLKQKYHDSFFMIEETVKLIAPYFDRFVLEPDALNEERIRLEWMEVGSDKMFNARPLS